MEKRLKDGFKIPALHQRGDDAREVIVQNLMERFLLQRNRKEASQFPIVTMKDPVSTEDQFM